MTVDKPADDIALARLLLRRSLARLLAVERVDLDPEVWVLCLRVQFKLLCREQMGRTTELLGERDVEEASEPVRARRTRWEKARSQDEVHRVDRASILAEQMRPGVGACTR